MNSRESAASLICGGITCIAMFILIMTGLSIAMWETAEGDDRWWALGLWTYTFTVMGFVPILIGVKSIILGIRKIKETKS